MTPKERGSGKGRWGEVEGKKTGCADDFRASGAVSVASGIKLAVATKMPDYIVHSSTFALIR